MIRGKSMKAENFTASQRACWRKILGPYRQVRWPEIGE